MPSLNNFPITAKREKCVLALDAGGTFIKSAIVAVDGSIVEKTFRKTPVESQGPAETIIGTFMQIIRSALDVARVLKLVDNGRGGPLFFWRKECITN